MQNGHKHGKSWMQVIEILVESHQLASSIHHQQFLTFFIPHRLVDMQNVLRPLPVMNVAFQELAGLGELIQGVSFVSNDGVRCEHVKRRPEQDIVVGFEFDVRKALAIILRISSLGRSHGFFQIDFG